jgi:hypothetical protein
MRISQTIADESSVLLSATAAFIQSLPKDSHLFCLQIDDISVTDRLIEFLVVLFRLSLF